jgi:hypothetical protein
MSNRQYASFDGIFRELVRLCREGATGTLFVTGDNKQLAQISLKEGKIVVLSCQNKQGMDVVPLIRQIPGGWFQFITVKVIDNSSLPATSDILAALGGGDLPSSPIAAPPTVLPQQTVAILQDTLIAYVGPVASMLCNRRLQGVSNLELALDILAKEIGNPRDARQFKEQARRKF